jgi:uncharacterized protein (TIGR03437 family)
VTIPVILNVAIAPVIAGITPSVLPVGSAATPVVLNGSGYTTASAVEIGGTRVVTTFVDVGTLRVTVPAELLRSERVLDVVVVNPDVRSSAGAVTVTSGAPSISAVVHAATWQTGGVAPGQIAIIGGPGFGPDVLTQAAVSEGRLPTSVASVSVYFDDIPAPILWASRGQAAVLVPWTVSGRQTTLVSVGSTGRRSAPVPVPVQAAAPGLFTSAGSGQGQAAAFNQDGAPNSAATPADRGSVIVLYGTGEGMVSPLPAIGSVIGASELPRPVLPVTVEIGGVPATVEYAGAVAGAASGLFQVNVRVPADTAAGEAVPVRVSVGPHSSSTGVTVSIR